MRGPKSPIRLRFSEMYEICPVTGCWNWTGKISNQKGYVIFHGWDHKAIMGHRFSYEMKFGPIPAGLCCCHHCDNPKCVNPDHLFLGTNYDNVMDKVRKGRSLRGVRARTNVLTEEQVREIRAFKPFPGSRDILAAKYGVSNSTIKQVRIRETWKWLK